MADDVFSGSRTPSPSQVHVPPSALGRTRSEPSDVPRLRSQHSTAGYRDGIAHGKSTSVQGGFDEGYRYGAAVGLGVGYLLGILDGIIAQACVGVDAAADDDDDGDRVRALVSRARIELALEELLGQRYWDEPWFTLSPPPSDAEPGPGVLEMHPLMTKWTQLVADEAERWGIALEHPRLTG